MRSLIFFFFSIVFLGLTSCVSTRISIQVKEQSRELTKIAASDMSPEYKIEYMALDLIDCLDHALAFHKSKNGRKYLERYLEKNETSMNLIYDEFRSYYADLDLTKKGELISRQIKRPYVKELQKLIPRVEKKLDRKIKIYRRIYRFFEIGIPFI